MLHFQTAIVVADDAHGKGRRVDRRICTIHARDRYIDT